MNSIRTRLLLWLIVPLTAIAAVVSFETFFASRKISSDLNDRTLLAASLTIVENVVSSNGTLLADSTLATLTENLGDRFFYHVRGPAGAFVTGYSQYPRSPIGDALEVGKPVFYDSVHQGKPVRVVQMRQDLTGRELNGVTTITTWQQITKRSDLTFSLFARSLSRLFLLVLAAGTIVWFAVTWGLRPLTALQSAIDSRTPYDLTPIKRAMPVELKGIVGSMNELFDRVATSKRNRERFIGDAAHQLRNPVAAIKVQAEASLEAGSKGSMESGLGQIVEVADKSASMINKMLSGASAYALERADEQIFDLLPMVEEVTLSAAPIAFKKGQDISFTRPDHVQTKFRGNYTLLREAVVNLVDNAIRHNPKGAVIEVGLSGTDRELMVSVSDSGRVFSEQDFILHTQPFLTGDESSSGSGLGLSIAKDIAKSHGGYLSTEPLADGAGKKISIVLPLEPQTSA